MKGWGRRLSKPQRQAGALTADVLAVIRLNAVQPPEQAAKRARFDLALVAALSDAVVAVTPAVIDTGVGGRGVKYGH